MRVQKKNSKDSTYIVVQNDINLEMINFATRFWNLLLAVHYTSTWQAMA